MASHALAEMPVLPPLPTNDGDSITAIPQETTETSQRSATPLMRTVSLPAPKIAAMGGGASEDADWLAPAPLPTPMTPSPSKTRKATMSAPATVSAAAISTDWSSLPTCSAAKAFENLGLAPASTKETNGVTITRLSDNLKKMAPLLDWLLGQARQSDSHRAQMTKTLAQLRKDIDAAKEGLRVSAGQAANKANSDAAGVRAVDSAVVEGLESLRDEREETMSLLEGLAATLAADLNSLAMAKTPNLSAADLILSENIKFRELWGSVIALSHRVAESSKSTQSTASLQELTALKATITSQKAMIDDLQSQNARARGEFADVWRVVNAMRQDAALPPMPQHASAPAPVPLLQQPQGSSRSAADILNRAGRRGAPVGPVVTAGNKRLRNGLTAIQVGPFVNGTTDAAIDVANALMDEAPGFSRADLAARPFFWASRAVDGMRNVGMAFLEEERAEAFAKALNSNAWPNLKMFEATFEKM